MLIKEILQSDSSALNCHVIRHAEPSRAENSTRTVSPGQNLTSPSPGEREPVRKLRGLTRVHTIRRVVADVACTSSTYEGLGKATPSRRKRRRRCLSSARETNTQRCQVNGSFPVSSARGKRVEEQRGRGREEGENEREREKKNVVSKTRRHETMASGPRATFQPEGNRTDQTAGRLSVSCTLLLDERQPPTSLPIAVHPAQPTMGSSLPPLCPKS